MLKTIMVPLDGSPAAEHALPWALHLARTSGATLKLIRVAFPPPAVTGGDGLASGYPGDYYQDVRRAEWEYMTNVAKPLVDPASGVTATADLLDADDSAAGVLAKFVVANRVDLTVMTTHGRGPFARFWLGSVADEFLRRSDGPTLMLRSDADGPAASAVTPAIKRVLVPLDGSDLAEQVLDPTIEVGGLFGAEYTLLLVLEAVEDIRALLSRTAGPVAPVLPTESALGAAREYLERVAQRVRCASRVVRTQVIERGSAAEVILTEATGAGTMIALATHGHGGLTRMLFGSVADKVVRGATGPVLIVRPHSDESN